MLVVDAWMKSPAHRAVILTKAFRDIGVGAVKTEDGYANIDGAVWFFTLDLGTAGRAVEAGGRRGSSGGARKRPFRVRPAVGPGRRPRE